MENLHTDTGVFSRPTNTKFVFVTGGVVSLLDKGIITGSLGRLIKSCGYKVAIQKIDPILNKNAGNLDPYKYGEIFVTDDGAETDADLGHYERFIDEDLYGACYVTAGDIYRDVFRGDKDGLYSGEKVRILPHVVNKIKEYIYAAAFPASGKSPDVVICQIEGAVGDLELKPFLEAMRLLSWEVGKGNCLFAHVTPVPSFGDEEDKIKPTRHSIGELFSFGISPDIIICRIDKYPPAALRDGISNLCGIDREGVAYYLNTGSIYDTPVSFARENLHLRINSILQLNKNEANLFQWAEMTRREQQATNEVKLAFVAQNAEKRRAYRSISEALHHAACAADTKLELQIIDSEDLEQDENIEEYFSGCSGIIIPDGFGLRGIEGMINAVNYSRTNNIPFLGIGRGMEMAMVEFARNVIGMKGAHSTEIDPQTNYPVINSVPEFMQRQKCGSFMPGRFQCKLSTIGKIKKAYNADIVYERHRNRYEFNDMYKEAVLDFGIKIGGINLERGSVELIELPSHPWFVASQFRPEFISRPNMPHPLILAFVQAALSFCNIETLE